MWKNDLKIRDLYNFGNLDLNIQSLGIKASVGNTVSNLDSKTAQSIFM